MPRVLGFTLRNRELNWVNAVIQGHQRKAGGGTVLESQDPSQTVTGPPE